jgi:2-methylcitrate dehydratase
LSLHPTLKRFSVKFRIHSTIDGLFGLMSQNGLSYGDIAAIRVGVSESTREHYGVSYRPAEEADESAAMQAAQFSIRFAMAAVARYGPAVMSDLGPAQFNDREILDLAERIEVYREPDQEREPWMSWGSVVSIVTSGGETHTVKVPAPVGSPENPMQDGDVEEKFHRLADPVLGNKTADLVLSGIWHLEETTPQRDLIAHLVRGPAT